MSFLKKIFGKSKETGDAIVSGKLNFQYEVIPESGEKFAEQFVGAVNKIDMTELAYTEDSVDFVDMFLEKFKNQGLPANQFAETIFVAGCYVGQVMINNKGGKWIDEQDEKYPSGFNFSKIVVSLNNGSVSDPIAKAFKRFQNGEGDSLSYFYQVFTNAE